MRTHANTHILDCIDTDISYIYINLYVIVFTHISMHVFVSYRTSLPYEFRNGRKQSVPLPELGSTATPRPAAVRTTLRLCPCGWPLFLRGFHETAGQRHRQKWLPLCLDVSTDDMPFLRYRLLELSPFSILTKFVMSVVQ